MGYEPCKAKCPECGGQGWVLDCPRWPACGCPEGVVSETCLGMSRPCACQVPHFTVREAERS